MSEAREGGCVGDKGGRVCGRQGREGVCGRLEGDKGGRLCVGD